MKRIKEIVKGFEREVNGKVGFGFWDKKTGFKYFYNAQKKFTAASLNKLFVVGFVLGLAEKGKLSLADEIRIKQKEVVKGTGIIHLLNKREYTIYDLCMLTISESDNTAANKLIDLCGGLSRINNYIKRAGLPDTIITHKFMLYKGEKPSTTSVKDIIKYLNMVSEKKLPGSEDFKKFLLEEKYRHRTAFYITNDYGLKTAGLPHPEAVVHDVGIIFKDDGNILLAIFTEKVLDRKKTVIAMQNLGRDICNFVFSERLKSELPETFGKISKPTKGFEVNSYKFGEEARYDGKNWGKHLGQDFNARADTDVVSIADGKVVYSVLHPGSKDKRNWGNIIIIAHKYRGEVIFSLYGHIKNRLVEIGQFVDYAKKIGEIGRGYSKENGWWKEHLHFGIYKGDFNGAVLPGYDPPGKIKDWIDPVKFLR